MSDLAWNDYATILLIIPGCFFAMTGAIGILRMPDFYTRIHPAGKSDTLGQFFILGGLAFQLVTEDLSWSYVYASDPWATLARILLIIFMIVITAPTATHAITKAAYLDGLRPWLPDAADAAQTADQHEAAAGNTETDDSPQAGDEQLTDRQQPDSGQTGADT